MQIEKKKYLLESSLHFLGCVAEILRLLHDLADETLLALDIVVVELLVDLLQHGDPLDHVEAAKAAVAGRPTHMI